MPIEMGIQCIQAAMRDIEVHDEQHFYAVSKP